MKKQISEISLVQSSKIFALMNFFLFAVYFWIVGIITFFSIPSENKVVELLIFFLAPFVIALFTFIIYVVMFWVYNLVAGKFGGFEFELEDK